MNTPKMTVNDTLKTCTSLEVLPNSYKPQADHLVDFQPPVYNVFQLFAYFGVTLNGPLVLASLG